MEVDGLRRCQRAGSVQPRARVEVGVAVAVEVGVAEVGVAVGVEAAVDGGLGDEVDGSEGDREQAARARRKRVRRIVVAAYSTPSMRALLPVPSGVVDPATGAPRTGSYRGGLPPVDWGPLAGSMTARVLRHKRWLYVAMASEDVYVALAVVRLGYAANAFVYAYDGRARQMLARRSWMGPPPAASVGDTGGEGCHAAFRARDASIVVERTRSASSYGVHVETKGLVVAASLDAAAAPPAIGAVAPVAPGRYDATEKRALLSVRGELRVAGRTIPLDGALAGYDFTSGLLARRTRWRWGFALGRTAGGDPFALNLVEGFVGEAECAAWIGAELVPLAEGRFTFDRAQPATPWRVRTADGAADLAMTPGAVHEEKRELLLVGSRFVQPCGAWAGTIALPGREPVVVAHALGVTEDQDVTW
jgi:hypothetical protein